MSLSEFAENLAQLTMSFSWWTTGARIARRKSSSNQFENWSAGPVDPAFPKLRSGSCSLLRYEARLADRS